jgi:hypothetical protein
MWEKTLLDDLVTDIRNRSEYLPVWDEAVEEWLSKRQQIRQV